MRATKQNTTAVVTDCESSYRSETTEFSHFFLYSNLQCEPIAERPAASAEDMESGKIQQFQAETGSSVKDARAMLQGSQWDVAAAVKSFRFLQCSARPPVGPQKNCAASESAAQGLKVGTGPAMNSLKAEVKHRVSDKTPGSPNSQSRRLLRGLSKTSENIQLVNKARDLVLGDIVENRDSPTHEQSTQHFVETPEYTFILPDLTKYPEDFRAFLHKDLIETSTLVSLEQAGRLNWWADIRACQRLLPLATTGDGNCLLHAASLGMWGFHDRLLTLRKALHTTLSNAQAQGPLWRRWRWHQTLLNKQSGLIYDDKEWRTEWDSLLRLASSEPRTAPGQRPSSCCNSLTTNGLMERQLAGEKAEEVFYESLEELHVFVLAHVLRRPVIVVADTILKDSNGDALAPIPFGGIYLPLECSPCHCHRSPLLLTYDAAHFSALVPMEGTASAVRPAAACPLVDPEFRLLPVHFLVDPGPQFVWGRDELDPQKVNNLELATDDQLAVISRYLEVQRVLIPKAPLAVGEDDDEATGRPRCNSWSSEPPLTRNNSVELKKSKARMQSVAKSFGSIGRTMSKKIKKNFTFRRHKPSVGSVTQSTKTGDLSTGDHVLCALLMHKRLEYQQQMMDNYLSAAEQRFHQDRDIRRQQDVEMKQRLKRCINPDCSELGAAATSYLCSACYEAQKGSLTVSQAQQQEFERKNTLVTSGKSRFYTYSDEQHNLGGLHPDSEQAALNNESLNNTKHGRQASVVLARSSFYDEPLSLAQPEPGTAVIVRNNLKEAEEKWEAEPGLRPEFAKHLEEKNVLQQFSVNGDFPVEGKYVTSVNVNSKGQDSHKSSYKDPQAKCVTLDCEYYGSEITDFLCSKCFREKERTLNQLADRSTIL